MSAARQLSLFDLLTSSAEASPARTSQALAKAPVWLVPVADSGSSTTESSPSFVRPGSSSKTSRQARASGCPMCGTDCGMSDTIRPQSRFLPSTSARPTSADECSLLLPTPSASGYGSSNNGCPGDGREQYATRGKLSLRGMARRGLLPTPMVSRSDTTHDTMSLHGAARLGLLPTPTVTGNNNRKGASPNSGDGLATVMGGPLNPRFTEWLMGFEGGAHRNRQLGNAVVPQCAEVIGRMIAAVRGGESWESVFL